MVRMMKHYVQDPSTGRKCRVYYSYSSATENTFGKEMITIRSKSLLDDLSKVFPNAINNSDSMTDYFEKDRVRIFPEDKLWNTAITMVNI